MVDFYEEIAQIKKEGKEAVLVQVVDIKGHTPSQIGSKMIVFPDGKKMGTVGGGAIEYIALQKIKEILQTKKSISIKYSLNKDEKILDEKETGMICGGEATLFFEYIGSIPNLYIFGAGHIGKSLVYHLKNLNYQTLIIDCRKNELDKIDDIKKICIEKYQDIFKSHSFKKNSFFIVVTHSHKYDFLILNQIYESDLQPKYIGVIASKSKAKEMKTQLMENVKKEINLDILYSPIGLNTGGKSPSDIAVSIISEIQVIYFGKEKHNHCRLS